MGVSANLAWKREVMLTAFFICKELAVSTLVAIKRPPSILASQHFLNFLPDPHGQGSFRPVFFICAFCSVLMGSIVSWVNQKSLGHYEYWDTHRSAAMDRFR